MAILNLTIVKIICSRAPRDSPLSADRLAPGLARRGDNHTREIDLILARHVDAFEFHFVGTAL
jgi:hypothetical protein